MSDYFNMRDLGEEELNRLREFCEEDGYSERRDRAPRFFKHLWLQLQRERLRRLETSLLGTLLPPVYYKPPSLSPKEASSALGELRNISRAFGMIAAKQVIENDDEEASAVSGVVFSSVVAAGLAETIGNAAMEN